MTINSLYNVLRGQGDNMNYHERIIKALGNEDVKFTRKQLNFLAKVIEFQVDEVVATVDNKDSKEFKTRVEVINDFANSFRLAMEKNQSNFNVSKWEDAVSRLKKYWFLYG